MWATSSCPNSPQQQSAHIVRCHLVAYSEKAPPKAPTESSPAEQHRERTRPAHTGPPGGGAQPQDAACHCFVATRWPQGPRSWAVGGGMVDGARRTLEPDPAWVSSGGRVAAGPPCVAREEGDQAQQKTSLDPASSGGAMTTGGKNGSERERWGVRDAATEPFRGHVICVTRGTTLRPPCEAGRRPDRTYRKIRTTAMSVATHKGPT